MKRLLILCSALLLLSSCGDNDPNRPELPPAPPLQATSVQDVSDLLEVALTQKRIERYDSLLARDYTFIFNPLDAQNDTLDIPESWGLSEDLAAVGSMFAHPSVEEVKVSWTAEAPVAPQYPNTDVKMIIRPLYIEVTVLTHGEPLFLQAQGAFWLHLRKEPWTTADGDSVWKVVWWEDKTQVLRAVPGRATQTITWGHIKALW